MSPVDPAELAALPKAEFAFPGPLRDRLVRAILDGDQVSTTGLAVDEGEGFASVEDWRRGHEAFWHGADMRAALGDPDFVVDDSTAVVLERFRLVERLD